MNRKKAPRQIRAATANSPISIIGLLHDIAAQHVLAVSDRGQEAHHREEQRDFGSGHFVTAGGRVLGITALGDSRDDALARAYSAVDVIDFEGKQLRRDIGWRARARA